MELFYLLNQEISQSSWCGETKTKLCTQRLIGSTFCFLAGIVIKPNIDIQHRRNGNTNLVLCSLCLWLMRKTFWEADDIMPYKHATYRVHILFIAVYLFICPFFCRPQPKCLWGSDVSPTPTPSLWLRLVLTDNLYCLTNWYFILVYLLNNGTVIQGIRMMT